MEISIGNIKDYFSSLFFKNIQTSTIDINTIRNSTQAAYESKDQILLSVQSSWINDTNGKLVPFKYFENLPDKDVIGFGEQHAQSWDEEIVTMMLADLKARGYNYIILEGVDEFQQREIEDFCKNIDLGSINNFIAFTNKARSYKVQMDGPWIQANKDIIKSHNQILIQSIKFGIKIIAGEPPTYDEIRKYHSTDQEYVFKYRNNFVSEQIVKYKNIGRGIIIFGAGHFLNQYYPLKQAFNEKQIQYKVLCFATGDKNLNKFQLINFGEQHYTLLKR